MKLHSFQELVRRVVHLSTRDGRSIPVTWNGTTAYTSKNVVNIPALPAGTVLTKHQCDIWLGYTIHEGPGHQTHTDLDYYESECKKRNNQMFSYLFNVLEDIRIENATIARYPGDRRFLDAVHQFVDDKIPPEQCQNPDILGLIYKEVYVEYRKFNSGRIAGQLGSIPIKNALKKLPTCSSTADCAALADEILKLLQENEEHQQQQEQQKQNDQKSQGSDSNDPVNSGDLNDLLDNPFGENSNEGEGEGENSTSNPNGENPSGNSNKPDNSNSNSNEHNPNANKSSAASAETWEKLTEIKNAIEKIAKEILADNQMKTPSRYQSNHSGSAIFPPVNIALDKIFVPSGENMNQYLETRSEFSAQILSLKKMFRIYLQSKAQKSWLRGLEEGSSLDRDRLFVAATGSNTIFREHHSKPFINTAIELMLDLSASMDIDKTRAAAIVLAEALASIPQIKLSISGFSTNGAYAVHYNNILPNMGRCIGMDIYLFKDFETPYIKSRAKLGAISSMSYTPLGDAYGKALEHLIPRTEPRKILFLVTDGEPEFKKGKLHSDYLLMEQIKLRAKKLNIETFGLALGNSASFLEKYVEKSAEIDDLETLPQTLMSVLKQIIR